MALMELAPMVPKQDESHHGFWGWFNYERRNWIAMILLAAGLGTSWGQAHMNAEWVKKETAKQVAPVVAQKKLDDKALAAVGVQLGCQKNRADVATASALGAGVDPSAIPSCPPVKVPPAVLAVVPPPLKAAIIK